MVQIFNEKSTEFERNNAFTTQATHTELGCKLGKSFYHKKDIQNDILCFIFVTYLDHHFEAFFVIGVVKYISG